MAPRKETMTPPERMFAVMTGQKPDRVPFIPFGWGFTGKMAGYPIEEIYTDPQKCLRSQLLAQELFGYDGSPMYVYAVWGVAELGGEIAFPDGKNTFAPHATRAPWTEREALLAYEVPEDVSGCGNIPLDLKFYDMITGMGMPAVMHFPTPFNTTAMAMDPNNMLKLLKKEPELVRVALRKVTDFYKKVVDLYVGRYGAEKILALTGEAVGSNQLVSPKLFGEFAIPFTKELHDYILSKGVMGVMTHICGEQNANFPYWQEVNFGMPGVISFSELTDLEKAKEIWGEKVVIAGNIDTAVIENGTPEEVYEETKKCILKGKDSPKGFILMSSCDYPISAPPINLYMIMKAVRDFGFYE